MNKLMRRIYLLLLLCLPFLAACGGDDPEPVPEVKKGRTVLVYIVADNNDLDFFAKNDLEEMKNGWLTNGFNSKENHLLVYIDSRDTRDTKTTPRLVEISMLNGVVGETLIKEYPNRNSCGMAEMKEVFADAFGNKAYEAESYGLVYWSHGDGWIPAPGTSYTRWMGQDKGEGNNYMNITEFASVLQGAPHFDFILFDACFMQSIEVAYEIRNFTDYYIGSPTETPGPGAPYDIILPYMMQKGGANQLATAYYNYYYSKYKSGAGLDNTNWTAGTAISVIKTSGLEALAKSTKSAFDGKQIDRNSLRKAIFNYDQRERSVTSRASHVGYYDLMGMMESLVTDANKLKEWKSAYQEVTGYWATTPKVYSMFTGMFSMAGANGITHYIPSATDTSDEKYYHQTQWCKDVGLAAIGF